MFCIPLAFHSVDRILGVRKLHSFGMNQRHGGRDSNFSGAQHGFGYADFEGRIASTGKQNKRILGAHQLQTQTDSVEKQFFLEEQIAVQTANEIDGFAFLRDTFSFHETGIGVVRRIHGSGIVFVPKASGQLRIFGRFAVVEQSFQESAIRVITGGRRYEFVVERHVDVTEEAVHQKVHGCHWSVVSKDVAVARLYFDAQVQMHVGGIQVIVTAAWYVEFNRADIQSGGDLMIVHHASLFYACLRWRNVEPVQFALYANARLSEDQSHHENMSDFFRLALADFVFFFRCRRRFLLRNPDRD